MGNMRLPMHRSSNSGTLASGENYVCATLRYDPTEDTLMDPSNFDDDLSMISSKPLVIRKYKFIVTSEGFFRMFQVYFNWSDYTQATSWLSLGEYVFQKALKQHKVVPGAVQTYPTNPDNTSFATSPQWASRTITFKAGRYSKKFDRYIGGPAPIQLSRTKCDTMAWCVYAQNTAGDDRDVYWDIEVDNWKQIT